MKLANRFFVIAVVVSALGCVAYAAEVQGVLLDRMCSAKIAAAKDQKAAKAHGLDCLLMPDCAKAGYGVLTADGKFITLDAAGNQKALAALKASKKKDDFKVQVTGEPSGDAIKVSSLKIL